MYLEDVLRVWSIIVFPVEIHIQAHARLPFLHLKKKTGLVATTTPSQPARIIILQH